MTDVVTVEITCPDAAVAAAIAEAVARRRLAAAAHTTAPSRAATTGSDGSNAMRGCRSSSRPARPPPRPRRGGAGPPPLRRSRDPHPPGDRTPTTRLGRRRDRGGGMTDIPDRLHTPAEDAIPEAASAPAAGSPAAHLAFSSPPSHQALHDAGTGVPASPLAPGPLRLRPLVRRPLRLRSRSIHGDRGKRTLLDAAAVLLGRRR